MREGEQMCDNDDGGDLTACVCKNALSIKRVCGGRLIECEFNEYFRYINNPYFWQTWISCSFHTHIIFYIWEKPC